MNEYKNYTNVLTEDHFSGLIKLTCHDIDIAERYLVTLSMSRGGDRGPRVADMTMARHKACHDDWNEECKIFVGGLGEEGTRIELDEAFGKFGPIKNIWLAKQPPSFAYVEMEASFTGTSYNLLQFIGIPI